MPRKKSPSNSSQSSNPVRGRAVEKATKLSMKEKSLLARAAHAQACVDSLYEYLQEAWKFVEPGMPLHLNWHIKEVCRENR